MTKYVIQSGGIKRMPGKAQAYFAELLKDTGPNPTLLWCYFATLPDPIEERYQEYLEIFSPSLPKDIHINHVCGEVEKIEEQFTAADVIYLHGGSVGTLADVLEKYDLPALFSGKSIGVNSASTLYIAKHGWTCDERECIDGLGIWPARVGVHFYSEYGSDDPRGPINWDAAYKELEAYGDTSLPIYALEEGEYIVFEI